VKIVQYRGYSLPRDLGIVVSVLVLLCYYTFLLRLRPLPVILERIRSGGPKRSCTDKDLAELEKVWRGGSYFLRKLFGTDKPCLRRTLVLYRWCARRRLEAGAVIGVKKEGGELAGHSWLLLEGRPFKENEEELRQYVSVLEG
jgi:hypothetical protein